MPNPARFPGLIASLYLASLVVAAQNPIHPPGTYFADPAARVGPDGRLYVYTARDESPERYCSWEQTVLHSKDLHTWEIAPRVFASRGEGDRVAYRDRELFAPDAVFHDGTWYLFYCLAGGGQCAGVATSESPTGPFGEGRLLDLHGRDQIDPAVFLDDDGAAYYLWGQFTVKMAKLRPDLLEIDPATMRDAVLTEEEHFFHEGVTLTKRGGLYYLVYSHMGRAGMPTCLGYATSSSPTGPYRYRGVLIDNDHCDPGNWNNHGSLVELDNRWYLFYHRSTHASKTMRKVCVEPIEFHEDGSIDEVEMTSQGIAGPLDANAKLEAERACLLYGQVRIQAFSSTEEELARLHDGDRAAFKYLDFGAGVERVTLRVRPGREPARIDIVIGNSWGPAVGRLEIPPGSADAEWSTLTAEITPVTGVHALWLKCRGGAGDLAIDWVRFDRGE